MIPMDIIILGVDTFITFVFYKLYKSNKEAAKKVQDAPDFEVTPELLSTVKDAKDQTIPYACIRGPVEAEDVPIKSMFRRDTEGVVQVRLLKEFRTRRLQGHWSDNTRILRDITNAVPFVIAGLGSKVKVTEPHEAGDLPDQLTVIYDHFEPAKTGWLERGLDRIMGDVSKGFQETEKMLTVGTKMTGIGELSVEKGSLNLKPPSNGSYILSTLTKVELVKKLQSKANIFKVLGGIFCVTGGVVLFLVLKRFYQERQRQNDFEATTEEIRNLRRENLARTFVGDTDGDDETRFCVICLTNPREVVILNCGHICICADCVEMLPLPRKCPVCRNGVERILPIYVS